MLAITKSEAGPGLTVSDVAIPKVGPTDVLVKVKAASICGTDVHIYEWDDWAKGRIKAPVTIGHEFCGMVVEIGSDVRSVAVGDFVSAESHIPCMGCFQCRNGQMHICHNLQLVGIDVNGGLAEYAAIPERCCWKNDPDLSPEIACIQEPLGCAVYAATAESLVGLTVAVFGCGPLGLFAVGSSVAAGARSVYSVIKHEFRREIAGALGATRVLNTRDADVAGEIVKLTDGVGVDVAIEVSGSQRATDDALRALRKGGRVVALGLPKEPLTINLTRDVVFKEARIVGLNGRKMYETWHHMQSFLRSGKLNPLPVVTHRFPLAEFELAMRTMIAPDRRCGKVLLIP